MGIFACFDKVTRKMDAEEAEEQGFDEDEPEGDFDFIVTITTPVSQGKPLQTTVILLVDRIQGDDESRALLVLDSIDSELMAKPKKKRKG